MCVREARKAPRANQTRQRDTGNHLLPAID
jgi:hypothetical protein